jgi:ubiquinone biosynthesis protein COQ9
MPQVCICAVSAARSALRLCAAGDLSSDLSWYSKRAALAAVYGATELFMITGASFPGHVCSMHY